MDPLVEKELWTQCLRYQGTRYTPRNMLKGYNKQLFAKVCEHYGLSTTGSKEELYARLVEHVSANLKPEVLLQNQEQ